MRSLVCSLVSIPALLAIPALAHAQAADPTAAPAAAPPPAAGPAVAMPPPGPAPVGSAAKLWAGGALQLLPVGNLSESGGGTSDSESTAVAFAISGLLDYRVTPNISVGFWPRYVLNINSSNGNSASASMLDLRVRGSYGKDIAPQLRLYGFGALGYSDIFVPDGGNNANGLTLTIGGGVGYYVAPKIMLTGEIGYEFGFEGASEAGTSISFDLDYLEVSAGIQVPIGS